MPVLDGLYDNPNRHFGIQNIKGSLVNKRILKSFKSISSYPLVALTAVLLTACSSGPDKSQSKPRQTSPKARTMVLEKPQAQVTQNQDNEYLVQANIQAAIEAYAQNRPKAEIAKLLQTVNPTQFFSIEQDILLAKLFLHLEQTDNAKIIVDRLKQGALPAKHQISLWLTSAQVDAQNGEHLNSIRTLFRLSQLYGPHLSSNDKKLNNQLIWNNLLVMEPNALEPFRSDFGEEVDSWIQLAQLIDKFSTNPNRFSQQIEAWSRQHSIFSNSLLIPEQILALANVQAYRPVNLALILPFGNEKLQKQTEAIRDGFLSAAQFNSGVNYILLDSHTLAVTDIEAAVQEKNIDFIVGPLLKEKIAELQQSAVLANIPQLNLNTVDVEEPSTGKYFFALSPEDEIEQAVSYFVKKDIQYPAIIYADNSLGRRLSKQFSDLWLATTEKQLESIAFQSKSKLGQAVKDLLDVGLSEQRIKQIKTLLGAQIKSEERSRTDIDAIYVIANSQQTRLIKPFFDVNVSKFAKQLPIYASSRSYVVGESRNQKLDLNGLTFTEMPWIVNGKNTQLNKVYEQIGDKNTQSKKLFAFGYDSFKLIPILNHLAILPEVAVESLTGTLKIDKTGRIKRNLEWAQYRQGNVVIVKTNRN